VNEIAAAAPRRHAGPAPTAEQLLLRQPGRFALDAAAGIAAEGDVLSVRFRTVARLGHPLGEVVEARPKSGEMTVSGFGLVGPGGVLPRHMTAAAAAELRRRSPALHVFLDLLGGRFTGLFIRAGAKYRPTRDPVPAERALAAAIGLGTPQLAERTGLPLPVLLYHAGNLASRSRSASRLAAMLEEETGCPTQIEEFTGGWVRLPPEERTRMAGGNPQRGRPGRLAEGQHAQLGGGAVLGSETWDAQSRFAIRIGPLDRAAFEALLPGTPGHARIATLARLFVGLDVGFVLNPVLDVKDVGPLALGRAARLGWTSWLTAPLPRRQHGAEPRFEVALHPGA
jgi:type VI secretion system protein ImpH